MININFNLKKLSYVKGEKFSVNCNLLEKLLENKNKIPNKIAIITSNESWTYDRLYIEVLIWKNRIKSLNLNGPTIICLHRTPKMLAILLAMQWLEISYIPVEITTPIKRIRAIIEDSKAEAILHDTLHAEEFISLPCNIYDTHDLQNLTIEDYNLIPNEPLSKSSKIVYIIYTSGSTGNPKGVSISSKALNNFLSSTNQYFTIDEIMLASTTIAFDISYLELYLPIWQGKTIFLANQNEYKDPEALKNILMHYPISIAQGTPSFWNMLYYSGWRGKKDLTILSGGEPLNSQLVNNFLDNTKAIWNMYGPTEATIWCSTKKITSSQEINVGKPLHNLEMLVLDSGKKLVPIGTKGQLYIGGIGLADGYYNHQRLTEDKFISIKIGLQNKRIYNTGDIARINESQEIEVFGRVDNQIKLHGYRIELEDIEAHIQANLGVRECVVGVQNEQLIAYICINANGDYSEDNLKKQLLLELPEFMVPKRFVYLDKIPVNNSGKLDRKALSLPDNEIIDNQENDTTPLQEIILNIWQETLNINNINVNSSFFELGGHSLTAVRIVNKIKELLNKSIKINDIYHAPTIAELAELVGNAPEISAISKNTQEMKSISSWVPLTDFQFVLWIANIFEPEVKKLNVADRKRIKGKLSIKDINKALQYVIQNHDVFSYKINSLFPIQKITTNNSINWQEISLESLPEEEMEQCLNRSLKDLILFENWSRKKGLLIAKLFYLSNDRIELQISMPHMISDQQSVDIFFKSLSDAYNHILNNRFLSKEDTLVEKLDEIEFTKNIHYINARSSFINYAQNEYYNLQSTLKSDETFWLKYLEDASLFNFPKQHIIPCNNNKDNNSYSSIFAITDEQIQQWKNLCIQHTLTLNDIISAATSLTLKKIFADKVKIPENLFINTVKSSREDPTFDNVIGCFIKVQPIKIPLKDNNDLIALAKQAQISNAETANYQDASSLIKLSSIGQVNFKPNKLQCLRIALLTKLYSQIFKRAHNLNLPIIKACKRLAGINKDRGFLISINIWHNFFGSTKIQQICGNNCVEIPNQQRNVSAINGVLEVCLMRDDLTNDAYLIISANLKESIREIIGKELLNILNQRKTQNSFEALDKNQQKNKSIEILNS